MARALDHAFAIYLGHARTRLSGGRGFDRLLDIYQATRRFPSHCFSIDQRGIAKFSQGTTAFDPICCVKNLNRGVLISDSCGSDMAEEVLDLEYLFDGLSFFF